MDNKEQLELDINALKDIVKDQVDKAYRDGLNEGAIITCTTIYQAFQFAGLEETNILYTLLKNIAKNHGCNNLVEYMKNMKKEIAEELN